MTPSAVRPCVLHRPTDSVPALRPRSSHRDRIHILLTHPYTHIHTNSSYTPTPHTHTQTAHSLLTHTHTPSHTPHTHTQTPHTCLTITHTHNLIHSSHTHTLLTHPLSLSLSHTHTQAQSLQQHRHQKHGDPGAVLTHQAHGACGNSPESQLRSVTGPSTHWETLGL